MTVRGNLSQDDARRMIGDVPSVEGAGAALDSSGFSGNDPEAILGGLTSKEIAAQVKARKIFKPDFDFRCEWGITGQE